MKPGVCGLCRRSEDLLDSHLLPSGLYKFLREPSLKNPNPVSITPSLAMATSKEVRQHFLCRECEDRFNNGGERWILKNCSQPSGCFPLYDNLTSCPAPINVRGVALYSARAAERVEPDQITYFAASVFWRAAATVWRGLKHRLDMGPYQEALRLYLLGDTGFPPNAALRVIIPTPSVAKLVAIFPMPDRINGLRCHTFLVPGMIFTLLLGQQVPSAFKALTLTPSVDRFVGVSDAMYQQAMRAAAVAVRNSAPKGYLKGFWNGPDPRISRA
jgi:hypothetical protein